jgi:aerobic carbon-monoxide dehydrogenase medium subunit
MTAKKMKLPPFEYKSPKSLAEAVAILAAEGGGARPLAGGQSLLPVLAFRLAAPSILVDLKGIPDLRRITIDERGVHLGAMTRWRDIEDEKRLRTAHPLLVAAIEHVAHYQIRNRGTVGGSLAHADPATEMPGIAVACDAEIEVVGSSGARALPAADLFVGPLTTSLQPDEIITGVRLPVWPKERRWGFEEFSRRRGDYALAAVAVYYDQDVTGRARDTHVGVIGAGDTPLRLPAAEQVLNGRVVDEATIAAAAKAASEAVDPPDDIHAPAAYRRALVGTLLERALTRAFRQ